MSVFHEVDFPFSVALGAMGGPARLTDVVTLMSGREERNTPWVDSRRNFDAGPGVQSLDDLQTLIAFYEARRGRLYGFRFRDPMDHASCLPSQIPDKLDQVIGMGDGSSVTFQLLKRYESGGHGWTRRISKPVVGSVEIAIDGVLETAVIDHTNGWLTFANAPLSGTEVTAGYRFDCPVRFDSDRLDISLDMIGAGAANAVPLIELKL